MEQPFIAVDMRIYCARLLEDFAARGGSVVYRDVHAADLDAISEQHDLLVVATGRGGLSALFPLIEEHSPFKQPQRAICAGLFRGVAANPNTVSAVFIPEQGELFEFPIYSLETGVTGLYLGAVPGGALEPLARMRYEDHPRRFAAAFMDLLSQYAPAIYKRIDPARFDLIRPLDLLQGGVTPAVRQGHFQLANGTYAVALGDARAVNDPITGQGANSASATAWMVGAAICNTRHFDADFCAFIEQRIWGYTEPIVQWSNAMLQPPAPHVLEFMLAAAHLPPVADLFVRMYEHPRRFWELVSSPDNTAALLRGYGWQGMPLPSPA